jgi:hypothetical protein
MCCNPEMTPPWEPIAATLTRGQNGPMQPESIGRVDGGGRRQVRVGKHGWSAGMGDGSPGSRETEGEGGEMSDSG